MGNPQGRTHPGQQNQKMLLWDTQAWEFSPPNPTLTTKGQRPVSGGAGVTGGAQAGLTPGLLFLRQPQRAKLQGQVLLPPGGHMVPTDPDPSGQVTQEGTTALGPSASTWASPNSLTPTQAPARPQPGPRGPASHQKLWGRLDGSDGWAFRVLSAQFGISAT